MGKLCVIVILFACINLLSEQIINEDLKVNGNLKVRCMPVQSYTDNCFAGYQDNFLAFADKKFVVTSQGLSPENGKIGKVFDASHSEINWSTNEQVIIEINFNMDTHYWRRLGINFNYGNIASTIKIEGYISTEGRWINFFDTTNNNGNVIANISNQSYVSKLRFTISGVVRSIIRIEEIWGYNAYTIANGAFLRKDGGKIYGNISADSIYSTTGGESGLIINSPIGIQGRRTSFAVSEHSPLIYITNTSTESYPFDNFNNLIIQSRSSATRDILLVGGTNPKVIATFKGTGKVGIGTTTPSSELDVNGTVTASAFKVGDWVIKEKNVPDYVFKGDYKLKPLQEVENFARENNHLPDVPSASQMKEEGLDLVEMNMVLLKKVEELTLYTIEQQKRIERLEKKVMEKNEN